LHLIPEVGLPGGSIDYVLLSLRDREVVDFVGIELQTLDTTGTVWPARQRFLRSQSIAVDDSDVQSQNGFGMNWKMTAKTILVQMHHKIETFEGLSKHLVLVVQDSLYDYFEREFDFDAVGSPSVGNSMHFHAYAIDQHSDCSYRIRLKRRTSTDAAGVARCVGQAVDPSVDMQAFKAQLSKRIDRSTLLALP